jgi:hypothetical protein
VGRDDDDDLWDGAGGKIRTAQEKDLLWVIEKLSPDASHRILGLHWSGGALVELELLAVTKPGTIRE